MFTVTCLHGAGSGSVGRYGWPTWEEIVKGSTRKDILCKLPHPIVLSNRHIGWMNTNIKHTDALTTHKCIYSMLCSEVRCSRHLCVSSVCLHNFKKSLSSTKKKWLGILRIGGCKLKKSIQYFFPRERMQIIYSKPNVWCSWHFLCISQNTSIFMQK